MSMRHLKEADREFHLARYAGAASGSTWQIIHRMWNTTQHYRQEFTRRAAGLELEGHPEIFGA